MGEALAGSSSFLFFLQKSATSRACRPAQQQFYLEPDDPEACRPVRQQSRSGPTTLTRSSPVRLKKASSVGAVCGNDGSFTNKTDLSVTDGINPEHKQEQRQSTKDAGPARRCRQQTYRRVRNDASQHG